MLDLHHIRHEDVPGKVVRLVEEYWDSGEELEIITGLSKKMQDLVTKVLDEYQLVWYIGDYTGVNKGFIRVQM